MSVWDPTFRALGDYRNSLLTIRQMQRQAEQDAMAERQNALNERLTLAKLAEFQQAQAMEGQRRQAFSREFSASPVGPYAGDYATAENPRMPSLANVQNALFGMGDYEGGSAVAGMMPKPDTFKPQIFGGEGSGYWMTQDGSDPRRVVAPVPGGQPGGGGTNPYYTPIQTAGGIYSFDNRKGNLSRVLADGSPVVGSTSDPNLQRSLSEAKSAGKVSGETTEKAQIDLPMVEDNGNYTIQLVDDLLKHPGFKSYIGFTLRPGASLVDGTPEASFKAALDQIQGRQFLEAFQSLKGGGQITEIEGQKATAALSRMVKSNSEAQFGSAAREFQSIIRQGIQRARVKSRGASGGRNDGSNNDPLGLRQ